MVSKSKGGWVVKSESGKTISRVYPTEKQAQKRLAQIHYYSKKK